MPCLTPPSREKKDTLMLKAILSPILHTNDFGRRSPKLAVSFRSANEILLMVDGTEDGVTANSYPEDSQSMKVRQSGGVPGQVLGLKGVYRRKPDDGAPCKVETKVVMTDVDRPQIPVFVNEKVHHV
jgi:hypothetical protein